MSSPRIVSVKSGENFRLFIWWEGGATTEHDLAETIKTKKWAVPLRDLSVFAKVAVAREGYEIAWPGTDIDFSADGLWEDAQKVSLPAAQWMSAEQFRAWLDEMGFTWDDAVSALNVSRSTIGNYLRGSQEIPKTVWLACMQLAAARTRDLSKGAIRSGFETYASNCMAAYPAILDSTFSSMELVTPQRIYHPFGADEAHASDVALREMQLQGVANTSSFPWGNYVVTAIASEQATLGIADITIQIKKKRTRRNFPVPFQPTLEGQRQI